MSLWAAKRVVVTGGDGFLGSVVTEKLHERGCDHVFVPRRSRFDLREKEMVVRLLKQTQPDVIFHLADGVGGIVARARHPGRSFYDNALIGLQLAEQARRFGVKKFVAVGAVCAYPRCAPAPFREGNFWAGYPEEASAAYGLAKKMLLVQLQAYRQEFGFNGIFLLPTNVYGPGDVTDLETCHVIPATIRKCHEARQSGQPRIIAWGSGQVTREFLYVEDAAEGILLAAERYNSSDPVNLGSGEEISIRALVRMICELTGYTGEVDWDIGKPDGQPRRCLDSDRAEREFGFRATTSLREGLARTFQWYEKAACGPARVALAGHA